MEKDLAEELFYRFSISKEDQQKIFEYIERGYILYSVENSQNKFEDLPTKISFRKEKEPDRNEKFEPEKKCEYFELIIYANPI